MSYSRTGTSGQSSNEGNSTQQTTPQETEYSKQTTPLEVEARKASQQGILDTNKLGYDLISRLLAGQQLPGYLNKLPNGIDSQVTQNIVDQSLKDVNGQLAKSGVGSYMDSGVAQSVGSRTASDIRTQAEQFNIQNLMQLLNQGIGGQAGIQQNQIGQGAMLSQRLAGLTPVNTTNNFSSNQRFSQASQTYGASFFKGLFGA